MVWPWISATKEMEWARQFHVDEPFGTPSDDFGAQQRFIGMIMALLPKMQVQAWMQQPDRFQDSLAGDYAMAVVWRCRAATGRPGAGARAAVEVYPRSIGAEKPT